MKKAEQLVGGPVAQFFSFVGIDVAHYKGYRTDRAKMQFEDEQMQEFYECHSDIPSYKQLAYELGVDPGLVKFKFKALAYKDYDLPNIPETRADFLRNWQR